MRQNNVNINETVKSEVKSPIFTSKFLMNKELFYDFNQLNFYKVRKIFLIISCPAVALILLNILIGNYKSVVWFGPLISFLMLLMYLRSKKEIKLNYERNLFAAGKDSTFNCELFDDGIVSTIDQQKRKYFYNQVTGLFETKNFILIRLKYNLCVLTEKSSLNANVDEFKAFLIEKCVGIKKKKVINCQNSKKWSFRILIAFIVISLLGSLAATTPQLINMKPVHFRGLDYSTTLTDVRELYGEPNEVIEIPYTDGETYDFYETQFLGVQGQLKFYYFDGTENLHMTEFVINSKDFQSHKEYQKAVSKTYKHFSKTLTGYIKRDDSKNNEIDISWSIGGEHYEYSMFTAQRSDTGISSDLSDCTIFRFCKYSIA